MGGRGAEAVGVANHFANLAEQFLTHHVIAQFHGAGVALGVRAAMGLDDDAVKPQEHAAAGARPHLGAQRFERRAREKGADAPIALGIMKGFVLMKIMTDSWNQEPERGSRPFSVNRDGFVLAEGAWMYVLEEMEHAHARGAKILAEIAGYGSTCEAFHRVRLQECGEEPARAIGLAMQNAGIVPEQVDYVNLHGTSTQLNDRIETRALKLALGDHAFKTPMSALKSQIGHPQGACGAAGVAATIVAMQRGQIAPTLNLDSPDPECDLDYVPNVSRKRDVEHAVCNCIAFGSKNSALVLRKVA